MKIDTLCLFVKGEPIEEIYLGIKKRGFGKGKHVAVGGGVELGELPIQTAIREIHEETGLVVTQENLEKVGRIKFDFPAKPEWERMVHVYFVRNWQGDPQESDEIEPHWFTVNNIPYKKMWEDGQHWLPKLLDGEKIEAHFTFNDDNESLKDFKINPKKEYLWDQIRDLPYFRGMLRAVEAEYYQDFDIPGPIYDVGCGDGYFASLAFDFKIDVGLDPWENPIREAPTHGAYRSLVVADGAQTPFPQDYFASAISNSVLEHIEHIDSVLVETGRVLRSGAPFYFCVPNQRYFTELSVPAILKKLGLKKLAQTYENWFRKISRVHHADDPEVWRARLKQAGFELEHAWHYFSPAAMRALEWGHYFGLPSWISRMLTGKWILARSKWNLALTEKFARRFTSLDHIPDGTFSFFVARKI